MITKEKIDRINELAHKAKSAGLTEEERMERDALRKEYIAAFRANLKTQLDRIEIVDAPPARAQAPEIEVLTEREIRTDRGTETVVEEEEIREDGETEHVTIVEREENES